MVQYQVVFEQVVVEIEADDFDEAVDCAYEAVRGMQLYVDDVRVVA